MKKIKIRVISNAKQSKILEEAERLKVKRGGIKIIKGKRSKDKIIEVDI